MRSLHCIAGDATVELVEARLAEQHHVVAAFARDRALEKIERDEAAAARDETFVESTEREILILADAEAAGFERAAEPGHARVSERAGDRVQAVAVLLPAAAREQAILNLLIVTLGDRFVLLPGAEVE